MKDSEMLMSLAYEMNKYYANENEYFKITYTKKWTITSTSTVSLCRRILDKDCNICLNQYDCNNIISDILNRYS